MDFTWGGATCLFTSYVMKANMEAVHFPLWAECSGGWHCNVSAGPLGVVFWRWAWAGKLVIPLNAQGKRLPSITPPMRHFSPIGGKRAVICWPLCKTCHHFLPWQSPRGPALCLKHQPVRAYKSSFWMPLLHCDRWMSN